MCVYVWDIYPTLYQVWSFPGGSDGKASACNSGDPGSIPELGRSPGEENGNPLQYSCLENLMDRGAWQATVFLPGKSHGRRRSLVGYNRVRQNWMISHSLPLSFTLKNASQRVLIIYYSFNSLHFFSIFKFPPKEISYLIDLKLKEKWLEYFLKQHWYIIFSLSFRLFKP